MASKFIIATVEDNIDLTSTGRFYARTTVEGKLLVNYATPNSGLAMIPEVGDTILICQPDDTGAYPEGMWIYVSTLMAAIPDTSIIADRDKLAQNRKVLPDVTMYEGRGIPQQLLITSPKGNRLLLSDRYNPEFFDVKAELKSSTGKTVQLNDSPKISAIILSNEHNDRIKITTDESVNSAAQSIEVECRGPQKHICRESQMDVLVFDGTELNVTNTSEGTNAQGGFWGNINVESKNKDVNITVGNNASNVGGKININAMGTDGLIQIFSGNRIVIDATADIEVHGANISMVADGNLSLTAGGVMSISSGANTNIDGAQVFLNSGFSKAEGSANLTNNDYTLPGK